MHHRYFECNYAGFSAAFLDVVFRTYQAKFKEQ
jgi:sterol desaturase/sphingolipid hydroxylase (fatty acid hydroxylase superfamily)